MAISQVTSLLYNGGQIYLVKYGGAVTCIDAKSGKKLFREMVATRGYYFASPVAGVDKIYICSSNGVVSVIEAGIKFKVLSQIKMGEHVSATPVLMDGNIYLRTAKHVMVFGG